MPITTNINTFIQNIKEKQKQFPRLLLTPITNKTKNDYKEQMSRIGAGEIHMWDDSCSNHSKPGDYFGYVENQVKNKNKDIKTEGNITIYKIEAVCSRENILTPWTTNIRHQNRNVIILSKKVYYTGTILEFKKLTGYSLNWNCQGTTNVAKDKSDKYLKHISLN